MPPALRSTPDSSRTPASGGHPGAEFPEGRPGQAAPIRAHERELGRTASERAGSGREGLQRAASSSRREEPAHAPAGATALQPLAVQTRPGSAAPAAPAAPAALASPPPRLLGDSPHLAPHRASRPSPAAGGRLQAVLRSAQPLNDLRKHRTSTRHSELTQRRPLPPRQSRWRRHGAVAAPVHDSPRCPPHDSPSRDRKRPGRAGTGHFP